MFKHNICGSQPEVPDDMLDSSNLLPPKFFANPKGPLALAVSEAVVAKVDMIEPAKDLEGNSFVGDHS